MIYDHPLFGMEKENYKIMRYLDFEKFENLLINRKLYLTSAKKLISFDKEEGSITDEYYKFLIETLSSPKAYETLKVKELMLKNKTIMLEDIILTGRKKHDIKNLTKRLWTNYDAHKNWIYINCWSANEYESFSMWKAYTNENSGIAIVSTIDSLKTSINSDLYLICKKVDYTTPEEKKKMYLIDDSPVIFRGGLRQVVIEMLFNKRVYFRDEREVRLLYSDETTLDPNITFGALLNKDIQHCNNFQNYISIDVDPIKLINKIVLHPSASEAFAKRVNDIINRTGNSELNNKIIKSAL